MRFRQIVMGSAVGFALAACQLSNSPLPSTVELKIIAFNDFHGNLLSPGRLAVDPAAAAVTAGGIDYLAAYVAQAASLSPNHIVVSAGDLTGASPLISAAYHDEGTIQAMNALGLEVTSVGNHEFDGGTAELQRKQEGGCFPGVIDTCLENKEFNGAKFEYLAANVFDATTGKRILPPYAVKTFQGIPVAFIGVVVKNTPSSHEPGGGHYGHRSARGIHDFDLHGAEAAIRSWQPVVASPAHRQVAVKSLAECRIPLLWCES
jgi:5'-nucleotidase